MKILYVMLIVLNVKYMYGMEQKSLLDSSYDFSMVPYKQSQLDKKTLAVLLNKNCISNREYSKTLLEQGANPNTKIQSVLCDDFGKVLCQAEGTVLFDVLLEVHNKNIPEEAVYHSVKLLLEYGADPTIAGYLNGAGHLDKEKILPIEIVPSGYNAVKRLLKKQYRKNIKKHKVWILRNDLEQLVALSQEAIKKPSYNEPCDRLERELDEYKICQETLTILGEKNERRSGLPKDLIKIIFDYVVADREKLLVHKKTVIDLIRSIADGGGVIEKDYEGTFLIIGSEKWTIYEPIYQCYRRYYEGY